MLKKNLQSYCKETTLHGLKYLSNPNPKHPKLKLTQKVFWSVSVALSFLGSIFLTSKLVSEIKKTPIVSLVSNTPVSISEIPFPAVSFCPEFRVTQEDEISDLYARVYFRNSTENLNSDEMQMIQALDLMYNEERSAGFNVTFDAVKVLNYMKFFLTVRWVNSGLPRLHTGNWMQKYTINLATIPTRHGFCFNFNLVEPDDLLELEKVSQFFNYTDRDLALISEASTLDYDSENLTAPYPWKTYDRRFGFQAIFFRKPITFNYRRDMITWHFRKFLEHKTSTMEGVKLMLHDPRELPFSETAMFRVPYLEKSHFLVDPVFLQLDGSLYSLSPEERNCYLDHERSLKFFKFYTKNNCEHECLAAYTLKACGCVRFWMIASEESRICNVTEKSCHNQAEWDFQQNFVQGCKCFERCNGVEYKFELQQSDFHILGGANTARVYSFADVLFRENFVFPLTRYAKFNFVEFMSSLGGIMGLMIGCSFISFIEFFYFMAMRPFSDIVSSRKVHPFESSPKVQPKILKFVVEILENSSIHAAIYIAKRNWVEKIFWTTILVLNTSVCYILISKLHSVLRHPISISQGNARNVDSIPFPAITYLETVAYDRKFFNGSYFFARPNSELHKNLFKTLNETNQVDVFFARTIVCRSISMYFENPFTGYEKRIVTTLVNMSQDHNFPKQKATWNSRYNAKFSQTITSNGIGYTFNSLPAEDIFKLDALSSDFKFFQDVTPGSDIYAGSVNEQNPLKTGARPGDGFFMSLYEFVRIKTSDVCNQEAFVVHNVDELPNEFTDGEFCEINGGKSVTVLITPEVMETEKELRDFPIRERQCYMEGERDLRFFKKYSVRNCEMECLTENFLYVCGCVPFYMIRSDDMPICKADNASLVICEKYTRIEVKLHGICDCLPTCDTLNYKLDFFHSDIADKRTVEINFRYKDSEFTPLMRYRRVTPLSFLAGGAGLLGLYCGISILTIVEIFYFLIMRPIVNLMLKSKNRGSD